MLRKSSWNMTSSLQSAAVQHEAATCSFHIGASLSHASYLHINICYSSHRGTPAKVSVVHGLKEHFWLLVQRDPLQPIISLQFRSSIGQGRMLKTKEGVLKDPCCILLRYAPGLARPSCGTESALPGSQWRCQQASTLKTPLDFPPASSNHFCSCVPAHTLPDLMPHPPTPELLCKFAATHSCLQYWQSHSSCPNAIAAATTMHK